MFDWPARPLCRAAPHSVSPLPASVRSRQAIEQLALASANCDVVAHSSPPTGEDGLDACKCFQVYDLRALSPLRTRGMLIASDCKTVTQVNDAP